MGRLEVGWQAQARGGPGRGAVHAMARVIYDLSDGKAPAGWHVALEDRRRARQLPVPGDGARQSSAVALVLPQAAVHPGRRRRPGAPSAGVRAARLRGRGRARHRHQGHPGVRRRRVVARALGDRRQRLRRLRPALRRQGRQRPFQGRRRVHPGRAGAARRAAGRPGAHHAADLGQRRARAGRGQRRRPAVLLRRHRGRRIAADHARAGRRDPHRHPDRVHRGPSRRPGRGRGDRARPGTAGTRQSTGRLRSPIAEADYELSLPGAMPDADDAQREAAYGSRGAPGPADPPADLLAAVARVSTATLASQLRKRGFNHVTLDRLQTTRPSQKMAGFARTLRYVPFREDLFAQVRHHRRRHRAERPEARGRAGQAGRDPGHRGARRPHGRHRRRHARAARPGPRGRRHRHRRRDQGRADAAEPALAIPVYYAAAHPAVLGRRHVPWEVNVAVACAGVTVVPGDIIVGDGDGVIVVPAHLAMEVARDAAEQERQEEFAAAMVGQGRVRRRALPARQAVAGRLRGLAGRERIHVMRFRSDPARIRGSIAPVVSPFTADGPARPRVAARPGPLAARVGQPRHLPRRVNRRAERPVDRRAGQRDQGGRRGDRRPGAVRARHRLGQARRDARAHRGRGAGRRGRGADHHPVLRPADPGGPVQLVLDGRPASSPTCR